MMQRFALILLAALSMQYGAAEQSNKNLRSVTSRPNYAATHQRRQLSMSWWSTLLMHLHCPPLGPAHHKCMANYAAGTGTSGTGGTGGTGTSGSTSASSSSSGSSSGSSSSSSNNDGSSSSASYKNGGNNNGDNDGNVYIESDDNWSAEDEWGGDEWEESKLDTGNAAGSSVTGVKAKSLVPFLVGALAAGVIGAAFIVAKKRRQEKEENHPLEGSLKKRMKLFSGGVLRKNKTTGGDVPLQDDASEAPSFIEIASVRDDMVRDDMSVRSGVSRSSSYRAPEQPTLFENESDETDES